MFAFHFIDHVKRCLLVMPILQVCYSKIELVLKRCYVPKAYQGAC